MRPLSTLLLLPLLHAAAETPPKQIALVLGEHEYGTEKTLPAFAKAELEPLGFRVSIVTADCANKDGHDFKNWEALKTADLVLISARRRAPQTGMVEALKAHVAAGKPVMGIRTASHAFDTKEPDAAHATWGDFDDAILGVDYQKHFPDQEGVDYEAKPVAEHPILKGVPGTIASEYSLYRQGSPTPSVKVLLEGVRAKTGETAPVAWVNTVGSSRIFYTSLGGEKDFALAGFKTLLKNAVVWCLGK
jgi:type 1 glutamine amidotransferase